MYSLEAILDNISSGEIRTHLAKLYIAHDRFDDALQELHAAVAIDPQNCEEANNVSENPCVCMYVCINVCMDGCMDVCMYICMYILICLCN